MLQPRIADEITGNRSDHWNGSHTFAATFKAIRDAIDAADQTVRRLRELTRFAANANLERISVWTAYEIDTARPHVPHAVAARGRLFTCDATGASLALPVDFVIPTLSKLEQLRALL